MAADQFTSLLAAIGAGGGAAVVQRAERGERIPTATAEDLKRLANGAPFDPVADGIDDTPEEPKEWRDNDDSHVPQHEDIDPDEDYIIAPAVPLTEERDDVADSDSADSDAAAGTPDPDDTYIGFDDSFDTDDDDENEDGEDDGDYEDDDRHRRKLSFPSLSKLHPQTLFADHPEWKRPAAFAGAVGVLGLASLMFFSGSPASNNVPPPAPPVVQGAQQADSEEHEIVELRPKAVTAKCPPGSTNANLAWSGTDKDAWVCMRTKGRNDYMDNMILYIDFGRPVVVTSIFMSLGWNDPGDPNGKSRWNEHMISNKFVYRMGGKNYFQHVEHPTSAGATYIFPDKGVATQTMRITIAGTVSPDEIQAKDIDPDAVAGIGGDQVVNEDAVKSIALSTIRIEGYLPGSG